METGRKTDRLDCEYAAICLGRRGCLLLNPFGGGEQVTDPLPPAERLCSIALRRLYNERSSKAYKESMKTVRYSIEMALAVPDHDETLHHIERARALLTNLTEYELLDRARVPLCLYHEAMILNAQLPAFRERSSGRPLSTKVIQDVHHMMVDLLAHRHICLPRLRVPIPASMCVELEIACLLSRLGKSQFFPYWALEREERSRDHPAFNHDWYVLSRGWKCPVQIKTTIHSYTHRKYSSAVLLLSRDQLAGCIHNGGHIVRSELAKLLIKEDRGSNISPQERSKLDSLSAYCVRRIQNHMHQS